MSIRLRFTATAMAGVAALSLSGAPLSAGASTPTTEGSSMTASAPATRILTNSGYRGLRLGMTLKQAKATGVVRITGTGYCSSFDLRDHAHVANSTDGYISPKSGVVAIFARPDMATGRGIGIGSTLGQLRKAYPKVKKNQMGFWMVRVAGKPKRQFEFAVENRKVTTVALIADQQDCFN